MDNILTNSLSIESSEVLREYESTHPWITFKVNLEELDYTIWMLLGRIQAKCKFISRAPVNPDTAQELLHVFLSKGALATTAIEGNTLTEEEVKKHLAGELELPPSREYLGQQIDNVVEAYNLIADRVWTGKAQSFSADLIKEYNALILKKLTVEEDVIPGDFREHQITIGRYRGCPPQDCEYLINRFCDEWLNYEFNVPDDYKVAFEIIRAIVAHIYFVWIHPFGDGNGRTARLIEFEILLRAGIPDIAAHLLSNHYNMTRQEYYRQLDISSRVEKDVKNFLAYSLQGFLDGLNEQMETIQSWQLRIHWRNYVHRLFDGQTTKTAVRQRHLLLDLSDTFEPIAIDKIRHLTPRLAEDYAGLTDKAIRRDLNTLESMELITIENKEVLWRFDRLTSFLPHRARD